VSRPEIVFADEPTGNLDSRSGAEVLQLLRRSVDEFGQTIVMVTHDPVAAAFTDRVVFLADGKVVDELQQPTRERVLNRMQQFAAPTEADQPAPAGAGLATEA
jgi:putative ABC transport system ATP-binding protein